MFIFILILILSIIGSLALIYFSHRWLRIMRTNAEEQTAQLQYISQLLQRQNHLIHMLDQTQQSSKAPYETTDIQSENQSHTTFVDRTGKFKKLPEFVICPRCNCEVNATPCPNCEFDLENIPSDDQDNDWL